MYLTTFAHALAQESGLIKAKQHYKNAKFMEMTYFNLQENVTQSPLNIKYVLIINYKEMKIFFQMKIITVFIVNSYLDIY